MKIWQDDKGKWSIMRVAIMWVLFVGSFGFIWSIVVGFVEGVVTAGGLIAVSNWAKALQKKWENGT
jgi:hypothetical protein